MSTLLAGEELTGEVLGVHHADTTTGFGVIELRLDRPVDDADGGEQGARCAGPLAEVVEGQTLRVVGDWRDHPRYGRTFEVTYYEQTVPTTVPGLRSYLLSERFSGVTQTSVDRLLDHFGGRAGWVIENEPVRLRIECGLPEEQAERLEECWEAGRARSRLVRLLEPAGLPRHVLRGAFVELGAEAADVLRDDPYALLDVPRARFAHADTLARTLGIGPSDPRRLRAGARAAHAAARRDGGHQCIPGDRCVAEAARLLGVDAIAARSGLEAAIEVGELTLDRDAVYTPAGLRAERRVATDIARLLAGEPTRLTPHADGVEPSDELTAGQADAVRTAFTSPVSVLTGGPGTGKTRAIAEIVAAAESAGLNVALCAPTGRAAKRIEELVGRPASTIHRLLEARPRAEGGGFVFGYGGEGDRLPHDLVVCDEFSMCDTYLAAALLSAVDDRAHVVLVGDPDQLPPVGTGDVLADVLASGLIGHVRLVDVHRQAAASRIVGLANELNEGRLGELPGVDGDVYIAEEPARDRIVPRIVEAVAERIPDHLGVPAADVQVLAPVYRGPAGVDALNEQLRRALNPPDGPEVAGFRLGDRVMQTRNDPERGVSNGDIGEVVDVDASARELRVGLPDGEVTYDVSAARDLTFAWAVTVHKAQGGEWPVVVLVCDRSHRGMLWRNLVYTAVTRARDALIIVGQRAALIGAAGHDRPRHRHTRLQDRLREAVGEGSET